MAFRGYEVDLLTRKPESWSYEIEVHDLEQGKVHVGKLHQITDSLEVLTHADVIFSTLPSNVFCKKIKDMVPFLKKVLILESYQEVAVVNFAARI